MTEQIIVKPCDRTGWPAGPWDAEGDREEWRDEQTGLPCLANRNRMGAWCGYVAVPPGHPWHGVDYDNIDVKVHGGLTFASVCIPKVGICHVPQAGEPADVWWLGFDCAHAWDVVPSMLRYPDSSYSFPDSTYKDLGYVRGECARLAEQVSASA